VEEGIEDVQIRKKQRGSITIDLQNKRGAGGFVAGRALLDVGLREE